MIDNEENIQSIEPRPWGLWPTIGFSAIIVIVGIIVQIALTIVFIIPAVIKDKDLDISQYGEELSASGFYQSLATMVAAPFVIALILLFAHIRKGITIKQYLGFRNPGSNNIVKWILIGLCMYGLFDALTYLLDKPIVPEVMVDMYKSSYFPPLLFLVVIVLAPVIEELFFRGFLFEGIRYSRLKVPGAILITSFTWALLHLQYDIYGIFTIFIAGLVLGLAKIKTKSIYIPIAIHIIGNTIASIELVVKLKCF